MRFDKKFTFNRKRILSYWRFEFKKGRQSPNMKKKWEDYYALLQVPQDAKAKEIKESYTNLDRRYTQSDSKRDRDLIPSIKEAYNVLVNSKKRKEYDKEWLKRQDPDFSEEAEKTSEINPMSPTDWNKSALGDDDPMKKIKQKSARSVWLYTLSAWLWLAIMAWILTIRKMYWLIIVNIGLIVGFVKVYKTVKMYWKSTGRSLKLLYILTVAVGVGALVFGYLLNEWFYEFLLRNNIIIG